MKLIQRFIANTTATFLALYLVDSLAEGHFVVRGVWAAVILAVLLGFVNSLIRPLHRARTKPLRAALMTVFTILVNVLILQILAWANALSTAGFGWVLLAAVFVAPVTGAISWLIGFNSSEKPGPSAWPETMRSTARPRRKSSRLRGSRRKSGKSSRRESVRFEE